MAVRPFADPVAAALAEVRERAAATKASAHGYVPRGEQLPGGPAGEWLIANLAAAADVPRLLAALERALRLADGWDAVGPAPRPADEIQRRKCAAELRETISRELLGKGAGRG